MDCENCAARIATVNNDDELREKTAKEWSVLNNTPEYASTTFLISAILTNSQNIFIMADVFIQRFLLYTLYAKNQEFCA